MITHVLFDFFGTLVAYSASRTEQGYPESHRVLVDAGATLDYADFLGLWSAVSAEFDVRAERTHAEFSMLDLSAEFLCRALGHMPDASLVQRFVGVYLAEWNRGVRYLEGLDQMLGRLSRCYTLAVVTNTHDALLVPDHLDRMRVSGLFEHVVTSVEHGLRKPHPDIFRHSLSLLDATPARSAYVGDNLEADYRGARSLGMRAFLIDPDGEHPVPPGDRLESIFDLEATLLSGD